MRAFTKFIKTQLSFFKGITSTCSLDTARKNHDRMGKLMISSLKSGVKYEDLTIGEFDACMITPKDQLSNGVILYIHGGGFTCGDIDYAKGFGTVLASKCGIQVLCLAYRLAPEYTFPTAVKDCLEGYGYLISHGYAPSDIILCGESAGGGLCFSLCHKLNEKGRVLPAGIIAISPWVDLTLNADSYDKNASIDPYLTKARLEFYSNFYLYGENKKIKKEVRPKINPNKHEDMEIRRNPLVSPFFSSLEKYPPTIIFAGSDEIMLDDATRMHDKIISSGGKSELIIAKGMWHCYLLYGLKESEGDFDKLRKFVKNSIPNQKKLRWMSLDNAGKIYPASRSRNWSSVFRISATLDEKIDTSLLQTALDVTVRRFPSIAVRLKTGFFWYYLEEIPKTPSIMDEKPYPLSRMIFDDIQKCAFRVIVYEKRVALEFFHAITDGTGGMIFLKSLIAEYLYQKDGTRIECTDGVLDRLEEPSAKELEDSFLKNAGKVKYPRREESAFKIKGTLESDGYKTNTTFILDAPCVVSQAKKMGVSVTAYMAGVLAMAAMNIQAKRVKNPKRHKPIKILIPVNLRKFFDSSTLRNFFLFVTPGINPRYGEMSFEEICQSIYHQMANDITPQKMRAKITANVSGERAKILKIAPLFLKNLVLKIAFKLNGERKSTFNLSNLGVVNMPNGLKEKISRVDLLLGVQSSSPYNTGLVTYKDKMYLNVIRNIEESLLEKELYGVLRTLGLQFEVESNTRIKEK